MSSAMTDEEWAVWLRERSAEPEVRSLMALLNRLYEGDGYSEDQDGFAWLVIDATRIIDGVLAGRELNPGYAPDDRGYILDAMADSGRLDPGEPDPHASCIDQIEAWCAASLSGKTAAEQDPPTTVVP